MPYVEQMPLQARYEVTFRSPTKKVLHLHLTTANQNSRKQAYAAREEHLET
jgi:hypothetical protein